MNYQSYENDSVTPALGAPFFEEHLARYVFAEKFVAGKNVLELGCGHGYGSRWLALSAAHVTGCDLNQRSLAFARAHYPAPNLSFVAVDVTSGQALESGPFDTIICFEVLEHIPSAEAELLFGAIKKNLRPGGTLLLSTPNHDIVLRSGMPVPEFHINNLGPRELRLRLERHFLSVTILGQAAKKGPILDLIHLLDIFNLRHTRWLRGARSTGASVASTKSAPPPDLKPWEPDQGLGRATGYHFSKYLWRQAGMTMAICSGTRSGDAPT